MQMDVEGREGHLKGEGTSRKVIAGFCLTSLSNLHKLGVNSVKCSHTEGFIYFHLDQLLCVVVLGSEFRALFVSLKKKKINKSS